MVRNPNYWGPKGYEDEIFFQFFKNEGAMTEALKAGDIDYARNVTSDQFDSLKGLPNIVTVESSLGRGERLHPAQLQHLQQADQGRRRVDQGAPGPGLPRRPRLRHRQAGAGRQGPRRPRPRRQHDHPAGDGGREVAPRARPNPRTFDIELAKSKLDAAGYKLDANGKRLDKEGKPINLRMVVPERLDDVQRERGVHHRLVERARHRHDDAGARQRRRDRPRDPAGRRSAGQGRLRRRDLELGRRRRPELAARDPDHELHRQQQRHVLLEQAATTS